MTSLCQRLFDVLPKDQRSRSFYLYLADGESAETFTFLMEAPARFAPGEAGPAAFGVFIDRQDLEDLVEGFADVRAMQVDGRLRLEGDLGAGLRFVELLAGLGSEPTR